MASRFRHRLNASQPRTIIPPTTSRAAVIDSQDGSGGSCSGPGLGRSGSSSAARQMGRGKREIGKEKTKNERARWLDHVLSPLPSLCHFSFSIFFFPFTTLLLRAAW